MSCDQKIFIKTIEYTRVEKKIFVLRNFNLKSEKIDFLQMKKHQKNKYFFYKLRVKKLKVISYQ